MDPTDLIYYVIISYSWTLSILEPSIYEFNPYVNKKLCILDLIITAYLLLAPYSFP